MCGILALISSASAGSSAPPRLTELYEQLKPEIAARGPDFQSEISRKYDNSASARLFSSVLSLRPPFTPQPFTTGPADSVLLFNGELYNSEVSGNDTAFFYGSARDFGIPQTLSRFQGEFAFVYLENLEDGPILWWGRDSIGKRSLLQVGDPEAGSFMLASVCAVRTQKVRTGGEEKAENSESFSEVSANCSGSFGSFGSSVDYLHPSDLPDVTEVPGGVLFRFHMTSGEFRCIPWRYADATAVDPSAPVIPYPELFPEKAENTSEAEAKSGDLAETPADSPDSPNCGSILEAARGFCAALQTAVDAMAATIHEHVLPGGEENAEQNALEGINEGTKTEGSEFGTNCGVSETSKCILDGNVDISETTNKNDPNSESRDREAEGRSNSATVTSATPEIPAKAAVLFSGGIDCTIVACLLDRALPETERIDLLNVAFENPRAAAGAARRGVAQGRFETPDRALARRSVAALREAYKARCATAGLTEVPDRFRLVEIDVPYEEAVAHQGAVRGLMWPKDSVMDYSIALAFYFAARGPRKDGKGSRVLFSGLGADELFGGYSRHTRVFQQPWEADCGPEGRSRGGKNGGKSGDNVGGKNSGIGKDDGKGGGNAGKSADNAEISGVSTNGSVKETASAGKHGETSGNMESVSSGLCSSDPSSEFPAGKAATLSSAYRRLSSELRLDFSRLDTRNLGRDDRIVAHWGKEVRYPFLDQEVLRRIAVAYNALPYKVTPDPKFVAQYGPSEGNSCGAVEPVTKLLLRVVAQDVLGLGSVAKEKKRAIQFGARTAKMEAGAGKAKGHHKLV